MVKCDACDGTGMDVLTQEGICGKCKGRGEVEEETEKCTACGGTGCDVFDGAYCVRCGGTGKKRQ